LLERFLYGGAIQRRGERQAAPAPPYSDYYLEEAPLAASVPLLPPEVPLLEPPLGALELSLVLGDVALDGLVVEVP